MGVQALRLETFRPLEEFSEKEWELQIVGTAGKPGIARMLGWRVYHTLRSKGSQPGYPDWTLVRERVVFLELKREDGRLTPAQKDWLQALKDADAEVYVVRPRDLQAISHVLAARGGPGRMGDGRAVDCRLQLEARLEEELA